MSVNKVILVGRLGKDPEVRFSGAGLGICNFSLATDRRYTNKQGEKVKDTEWHRCITFGKLSEICGEYLHKGSMIYAEGRLQTRDWEDKDGNKRYTTEIVVEQMTMLDSKGDRSAPAGHSSGDDPFDRLPERPAEDDIPF